MRDFPAIGKGKQLNDWQRSDRILLTNGGFAPFIPMTLTTICSDTFHCQCVKSVVLKAWVLGKVLELFLCMTLEVFRNEKSHSQTH